MQAIDQSGGIAESTFRLLRFFLDLLIFLGAVAAARWGVRAFLLERGGRSDSWRRTYSAVNIVVIALLPALRNPAELPV